MPPSDGASGVKRCPRCGLLKDHSAFSPSRRRPDGLDGYCRTCNSERVRLKRARRLAADCCADCGRPRGASDSRRYCADCAARNAQRPRLRVDVRLLALYAYGGDVPRCACCGETQLAFLTLDHIDNDGRLGLAGGGTAMMCPRGASGRVLYFERPPASRGGGTGRRARLRA